MTFEEGMKYSIEETEREKCELLGIIQEKDKAIAELIEKKTALEKRIFELEKENERLHDFLTEAKPCECCKHYDEDLEKEDKEPCKNCFFDNSYWELKDKE